MTRFLVADDAEGEPTIFAADKVFLPGRRTEHAPVLRRCEVRPEVRWLWDDLVAAVLAGQEPAPVQPECPDCFRVPCMCPPIRSFHQCGACMGSVVHDACECAGMDPEFDS